MGGTALPLHKCVITHQKTKSGCEYMIKHFWIDYAESSFFIQVLETFEGAVYINGTLCPIAREKRLEQKDHWMKTLRIRYLYGINDKATILYKIYETSSRSLLLVLTEFLFSGED